MAIPRSACLLLCLISCLEPALTAQAPPEVKPPQFVKSAAVDAYSKEPYIFDLIQAHFDADGKTQCELTIRVRIQSQSKPERVSRNASVGCARTRFSGEARSADVQRATRETRGCQIAGDR